jgi:predicted metal-dependent hydrolase
MEAPLRAGIAIYNAGNYHAAHDAWEDHWLDLERGGDDEQFLHGLIQFTAAVYHATERNWGGATGLAESAREYLAGLSDTYRGVDVASVRTYLATLQSDPEVIERRRPLALTYEGRVLRLDDLGFASSAAAADVYAEDGPYDEGTIEQAIDYARADLDAGEETSDFVTFVMDFAREPENRGIVAQRLSERVARREQRESDVDGLFD